MTLATRLIPAADRETIVGDLLEEAAWRGMRGVRQSWWITGQCATIAAGLTAERARAACSLSLLRELAAGVAAESDRALHTPARTLLTRLVLFGAGVVVLAYSVEILISALLSASSLH